MWDVLGLGCVAVDDLLVVPEYPAPDSKVRVLSRERSCGGLTATALVAAARMGARTAFAGVLGDDEDSHFVTEALRREGVDVSVVVRRTEARPIHSTILVDAKNQSRTIIYDLAGSTGADASAPPPVVLRSTRVLLVDHYGIEGMVRATRIAREAGVAVVADFERSDWPGFGDLLALVDHLIVSLPFARGLTGGETPASCIDRLWNERRELVAVTGGEKGCWFRTRERDGVDHQPAFSVKVVDTTGCGDVFHGAYAAALARGMPVRERICLASAAGALKATQGGGHRGIPTLAEAERFITGG